MIRLNYGIQRTDNGGEAARAVAMLPLLTGSWQCRGGGLLLSTSGAYPFNTAKLQMPELMQASPLGRPSRIVNMNQLGHALLRLGRDEVKDGFSEAVCVEGPPVMALFVYNSNPAVVAPDAGEVLRGLARTDLFTVVHEQSLNDTTDYADYVLPAPSMIEQRELMGSYGHWFAQSHEAAIAPLGESRSNVWLFGQLAQRMGFADACFRDDAAALIAQALPQSAAVLDRETLLRDGIVEVTPAPRTPAGEAALPFSDAGWFRTVSGRARLLPLPAYVPLEEPVRTDAADASQPLRFLPRKADNFMNSTFAGSPLHQKMERRTAGVLEMHRRDAAARGIADGDAVSVRNERGRLRLTARVSEAVTAGAVAARLDWQKLSSGGKNVNHLTSQRLTDIGGGATFYASAVWVERDSERLAAD